MFGFLKNKQILTEKARLEAFLSAVPGEYCGWAKDGTSVYSKGFCDALGLSVIETVSDIQTLLKPDDARAFENLFALLVSEGAGFSMQVELSDRAYKLSGTQGHDLTGKDHFYILWLEGGEPEERQEDMLDVLPYPVWLRDSDQKIVQCNVAYSDMVGVSCDDVIAKQKELVAPKRKVKDVLLGAALAKAALEGGNLQSVDIHEVFQGKRRLMRVSEKPFAEGEMTLGFAQDVTHEEDLLQKADDDQSANRALLEQLHSAISIYGSDQKLEFYNSTFAQLWGLEDGWLNTKPKLGEVMEKLRETRRLPEQADFRSFKQVWLKMFTDLIEPHEDMLYLPDGSAVRMLVIPHKLGGLMMNFEDVTSRLELESSYNTLIAVQKETLDNLEEGVTVFGGDGRLKLWNPAFASLWGFEPEALEGEPHITQVVEKVSHYFNDTDWLQIKGQIIALALDRSEHQGRMDRADQAVVDYSTLSLPDGGVMITFTDVTDTVRVETALRDKNIALETAEKLKLDFLANVSYQLRTPLSAIMGFNEMLSQDFFGSLNAKQKEYTQDIHAASERLLDLINDILDLSTIEAGQMHLNIETGSLKTMMHSVLNLVTDWARKKEIEVSLDCTENIVEIAYDERRIKQALINLIRNAIAHTETGGQIELSAIHDGEFIYLSVRDNGVGISDEAQLRVLKPFERLDNAHSSRGAGLGLTLVKNIVDLHGGSFELQSEQGEGTTVTLVLPVTQSSEKAVQV